MLDTGVIYQIAGFHIIGGVQHQIDSGKHRFDIPGIDIINDRFDPDIPIDLFEFLRCSHCLGQTLLGICFVEQYLSLQIAEFDKITINDLGGPDAGPDQEISHVRSQRAAADNQYGGPGNTDLTLLTDTAEKNLP